MENRPRPQISSLGHEIEVRLSKGGTAFNARLSERLPPGGGHFATVVTSESQRMSFLESPAGSLSCIT